jgi:hypothetical protein
VEGEQRGRARRQRGSNEGELDCGGEARWQRGSSAESCDVRASGTGRSVERSAARKKSGEEEEERGTAGCVGIYPGAILENSPCVIYFNPEGVPFTKRPL